MSKENRIKVRFKLSKFFLPGTKEINFGNYKIQPIPSSSPTEAEALLTFNNIFKDSKIKIGNPEEEANIVLRLLSLFLNTHIKKTRLMINEANFLTFEEQSKKQYKQFFATFDPTQLEDYLKRVLSLKEHLAKQFIRASHTYSFALEFIPSDPTFAFFLLVVAGECMSSQDEVVSSSELHPDSKKCERFCHFINSFFPDELKGKDELNKPLFKELLKIAYYSHRSAFVHGGKEVSIAALMADKFKSSYIKHAIREKEEKTPGLGWFAKIIRGTLLGYLASLPEPAENLIDSDLLSRLALEKSILNLKARKKIKKGQPISPEDVEFR